MARSTSFQLLKFKTLLNVCNRHLDARSSLNKISVRYLRGSRYSKDHIQEEKYQKLLRTLKYGTKSLDPETTSNETISAEVEKTASESNEESNSETEIPRITPEDIIMRFEEKMIPWKDVPYRRQLEKKERRSCGLMRLFGRKLRFLNVPIHMGDDKLPCPVDFIIPSPEEEGYRNRDEFSIGLGLDGNEKTVGFFLDPPTEYSTPLCISSKNLLVFKDSHIKFAEDFQTYINSSHLAASQHYSDKGYWKNLIVRSNIHEDLMGTIVMNPQDLSEEEIETEKEKLKEYFSSIPKDRYNLNSLYFQKSTQLQTKEEKNQFDLIMGVPHVSETLCNLEFQLSPNVFFHQNTKAAEAMYDSLMKMCRVNLSTTVLDIFCGAGPVSMLFSPKVKRCIGVDTSEAAIRDATMNAELNNIINADFMQGQLDILVRDILKSQFDEDILVVLNPSYGAISKSLLMTLREFKKVDKIVYICSKPNSSLEQFIQLCRPCGRLTHLGKAFLPLLAIPYDYGPHTEQYGMIMMFQRM